MPVQHGSTSMLARMRRGYDREAYFALVGRARSVVDGVEGEAGVGLSTDIIAGFCGETEEEHQVRTYATGRSLFTYHAHDTLLSEPTLRYVILLDHLCVSAVCSGVCVVASGSRLRPSVYVRVLTTREDLRRIVL